MPRRQPSAGRARGRRGARVQVAIIVGLVGDELTPVYLSLADQAGDAAETRGATVARVYSPDATAEEVLDAVQDAWIRGPGRHSEEVGRQIGRQPGRGGAGRREPEGPIRARNAGVAYGA